MAGVQVGIPIWYTRNQDGTTGIGNSLWFFDQNGSPVIAYKDADLTLPWPTPIIMDASGKQNDNYPIFLPAAGVYQVIIRTNASPSSTVIYSAENWEVGSNFDVNSGFLARPKNYLTNGNFQYVNYIQTPESNTPLNSQGTVQIAPPNFFYTGALNSDPNCSDEIEFLPSGSSADTFMFNAANAFSVTACDSTFTSDRFLGIFFPPIPAPYSTNIQDNTFLNYNYGTSDPFLYSKEFSKLVITFAFTGSSSTSSQVTVKALRGSAPQIIMGSATLNPTQGLYTFSADLTALGFIGDDTFPFYILVEFPGGGIFNFDITNFAIFNGSYAATDIVTLSATVNFWDEAVNTGGEISKRQLAVQHCTGGSNTELGISRYLFDPMSLFNCCWDAIQGQFVQQMTAQISSWATSPLTSEKWLLLNGAVIERANYYSLCRILMDQFQAEWGGFGYLNVTNTGNPSGFPLDTYPGGGFSVSIAPMTGIVTIVTFDDTFTTAMLPASLPTNISNTTLTAQAIGLVGTSPGRIRYTLTFNTAIEMVDVDNQYIDILATSGGLWYRIYFINTTDIPYAKKQPIITAPGGTIPFNPLLSQYQIITQDQFSTDKSFFFAIYAGLQSVSIQLPNPQGAFFRVRDIEGHVDPDGVRGIYDVQESQNLSHMHTLDLAPFGKGGILFSNGNGDNGMQGGGTYGEAEFLPSTSNPDPIPTTLEGGTEARPINYAVPFYIAT